MLVIIKNKNRKKEKQQASLPGKCPVTSGPLVFGCGSGGASGCQRGAWTLLLPSTHLPHGPALPADPSAMNSGAWKVEAGGGLSRGTAVRGRVETPGAGRPACSPGWVVPQRRLCLITGPKQECGVKEAAGWPDLLEQRLALSPGEQGGMRARGSASLSAFGKTPVSRLQAVVCLCPLSSDQESAGFLRQAGYGGPVLCPGPPP